MVEALKHEKQESQTAIIDNYAMYAANILNRAYLPKHYRSVSSSTPTLERN